MAEHLSTADRVLTALTSYELKRQPNGEWRCNSPLRPGSNSHAFSVRIEGPEHGAYFDHVSEDKGSLYDLARRLGVLVEGAKPVATPITKRAYTDLAAYAQSHYAPAEAFVAAGWSSTIEQHRDRATRKDRPALRFATATGPRWRYLDTAGAAFDSPGGYQACWYRLDEAITIARAKQAPLMLCNGEPSAVVGQHYGVPATCITGSGERQLPDALLDELRATWEGPIVVVPDSDEKGRKSAPQLVQQLQAAGLDATAVNLRGSHGFDLADWCGLHGVRALTELLQIAQFTTSSPEVHRRSRLLHASQLDQIEPTTWLIDGVLAMNKLSETFAPPGSGKSFLELDKALCVAQQYPVVYVAAEAVEDYRDRVAAWCEHHKTERGQLYFWPEPVQLKNPESIEAFLTEIHPIGPAAIFFDPLASCMVGLDESSTADMTLAVEALNRVRRETGAAIHIVHHTGWDDAHERGSSVLRAACRIVMKLKMDDSGLITLTCEKANTGKPFEARYFRLVEAGPDVVPVPANKIALRDAPLSPRQMEILEALDLAHFQDGASFTQIAEHTAFPKSTVNKAISTLLTRGYISMNEMKRTKVYWLTDKGRDELTRAVLSTVAGASSPVHQGGELVVNWMVNNLGTPHQDAEFTEFTSNREKMAPVHPPGEQNSSPEFTEPTASERASSPEFTTSSPRVHSPEFTSSPCVPPLRGTREGELEQTERSEPPEDTATSLRLRVMDQPLYEAGWRARSEESGYRLYHPTAPPTGLYATLEAAVRSVARAPTEAERAAEYEEL